MRKSGSHGCSVRFAAFYKMNQRPVGTQCSGDDCPHRVSLSARQFHTVCSCSLLLPFHT